MTVRHRQRHVAPSADISDDDSHPVTSADIKQQQAAARMSRRRRRSNTVTLDSSDFQRLNEKVVEDVTLEFFYRPHTLLALVLVIGVIVYAAFTLDDSYSREDNFLNGLKAMVFCFLVISVLAFPNGPFTRPHPAFWRVIFGISVLYLMMLLFVLFQEFKDVKAALKYLDPERLNKSELEEKEYAVNCSDLTWERFWSHMDVFAFGHFFGWAMKAFLIRHWVILWYISITWEITEYFFAHLLPNFEECWWDIVLLDILMCNGLGICVGMWICRKFEMRTFHWESIKHIRSTGGKLKRAILQFTPASWTHVRWMDPHSSYMRIFAIYCLVLIWETSELCTFFLKHIFAAETSHPLVIARIFLIAFIGTPAIRQYYGFVTDPGVKRLGTQCWVYMAVIFTEACICIKFARELFSHTEVQSIVTWLAVMALGSGGCVYISVLVAKWKWADVTREVEVNGSKLHRYLDSSCENLADEDEATTTTNESSPLRHRNTGAQTHAAVDDDNRLSDDEQS